MGKPWEKYQAPAPAGMIPLGPPDAMRAPHLQSAQADAQRAAAEAPYSGQIAAGRAREATANATKAELAAREAEEKWRIEHPAASTAGVYGPDYLKTLPGSDQSMVKALTEGRLAFPQGAALRAPFWQQKLSQVAQYDPTFDATNYNARAKGRAAAISGKLGQSNNALNTAIGHAGTLYDQIKGTASHAFTPLNALENFGYKTLLGDKGVTNFEQTAGLLADELEAAYRNGGGSEHGVVRQLRSLDANASQDQKAGAVHNAIDLLASKVQANLAQYDFGTGGKPSWDMLDPHAREVLSSPQFKDIGDRYFAGAAAPPPPGINGGAGTGPGAPGGSSGPAGGNPLAPLSPSATGHAFGDSMPKTPWTKLDPKDEAAIIAFARDPRNDAAAIAAFARQHGGEMGNAEAVVKARNAGLGVNPDIKYRVPDPIHTGEGGLDASMRGVANGLTANFGAEIRGTGDTIKDLWNHGLAPGDNIKSLWHRNMDKNEAEFQGQQEDHPYLSTAGEAAGIGGSMLLGGAGAARGMAAAERAVPALGRGMLGSRTARGLVGQGVYGGLYGAGDPTGGGRMTNAAWGAGLAPLGQAGGSAIASKAGKLLSPVVSSAVQNLADHGIVMSAAQRAAAGGSLLGRARKGVEDAFTHVPILGDAITGQRNRQLGQFVNGHVNDAIAPIGATIPRGVTGNEAVGAAQNAVSDAYDRSLSGIHAPLDDQFMAGHNAVVDGVSQLPQQQQELFNTIHQRTVEPFMPKDGGALSGRSLQDIKRGLDKHIIKLDRTGNPADEYLADSLRDLRGNYFDWAARVAPDKAAEFRAANQAFANMVPVNKAAGVAKRDGIYSPDQALNALRSNSSTADFAAGQAQGQGYLQNAARILPSQLADSGTPKRLLVNAAGLAAGGGTAAAGFAPVAAIPVAMAAKYLPGVDRMLQSVAIGQRAGVFDSTGRLIQANKRSIGMFGSAGALDATMN